MVTVVDALLAELAALMKLVGMVRGRMGLGLQRQSPAGGVAVERGARVRDCAPSRGRLLEVVLSSIYSSL